MRYLRLAIVGIGAAAIAGCAAAPIRKPATLTHYAATVTTTDGWQLAVFHIPADPAATGQPHFGTPVLLVHGTSVNRFNYLTEGSDLGTYLASRGFDVWIPEYRGDRTSRGPTKKAYRSGDWDVEDIAELDLPAVLDHISAQTGREQVWWVGHSLGGILGYAVLQGPHAGRIEGFVGVGTPGEYNHPHRLAQRASHARGLVPRSGQVPSRGIAKLLLPTLDMAPDTPLLHAVFNLSNVDQRALLDFVGAGMENIGRGTLQQYLSWMDKGHLVSADGARDYTEGLAGITVPALLIAGRVDHIVPAWTVRAGYDRLGSTDKEYRVMGVGWGQRHDYGHGDLLVGDWAEDEVFPAIADFIEARKGLPAAPAEVVGPAPDPVEGSAEPWGAAGGG